MTPTSGGCLPTAPTSPTGSPEPFLLTLWTADAAVARAADRAGVHRVGVDLERIGKAARQAGLGTWISPHSLGDLEHLGTVLSRAQLFARINPVHTGTPGEVERVLAAGARVVMVPMVQSQAEAAEAAAIVDGRAVTVALVETATGLSRLDEICGVAGIDEVHIGLNDLALSLRLPSRWAVLAGTLLSDAAACVRQAGRPFGFGGIARPEDDTLPVPPDLVYAEYARTGATRALIARSFGFSSTSGPANVARALRRLAEWRQAPASALEAAHARLEACVATLREW